VSIWHQLLGSSAQNVLKMLVPCVSVFARCAPRQKEAVITALNGAGRYTLMCGDGTNDVGALKQSHIGISIISVPEIEAKQRSATEAVLSLRRKKGSASDAPSKKKKDEKSGMTMEQSLQQLAEAQEELSQVALGDASVASPFTSRTMSIKCCKDVLQQGRCTLVTMLQIYKILGVNCLVNALVLSKLHMHGVKQGDRQLTAVGVVIAGLFFFVTKGKPLSSLSSQRPPSSVLCKQALASIGSQFLIHFIAIMAATNVSLPYLDPDDPSITPDGPFNPNPLNTSCFLMTVLSTINTFMINYRGRPYMQDLRENKLLLRSIQICLGVLFTSALEIFEPMNQLLQLSPLPSFGFKITLCGIMAVDTIVAYKVEKALVKFYEG